MDKKELIKF